MADAHPAPACTPFASPAATGRFDPHWRTETVLALARGIAVHLAYDRLPILADALEEAGCDLVPLLTHCRHCPTHAPGCWAVDLALDRPTPVHPLSELTSDRAYQAAFRRIVEEPVGPTSLAVYAPPPPSPDWTALRILLGGMAVAIVLTLWITWTDKEVESAPPPTSPTLSSTSEEVESVRRVGETLRQLQDGWPAGPPTTAEP